MKKSIIIIIFAFLIMIFTGASRAADLSVGANAWYSWWDFDTSTNDEGMKFEPGLLYGPVVSLRFAPDWSVSTVFLYGTYKSKDTGDGNGGGEMSKISRYDSDTLLNYSINKYFKVFAGAKFMGFSWDEGGGGSHRGFGPGLGVSLTMPVTDTLFFLLNVSGLYLNTKHKQTSSENGGSETLDVVETGGNSMLSLAYYMPDISTSITLGFRAQYVKMDFKDEDNEDTNMLFYGVTLSAVYSFDI